jgi:RIO-like serine/threonine protein kinase
LKWTAHGEEKNPIFISKAVDDYGLDPYEFRVFAHVARRANGSDGYCNASQDKMADICGINKRKVADSLKTLCELNILKKKTTGRTNTYTLQKSTDWYSPVYLQAMRKAKGDSDTAK